MNRLLLAFLLVLAALPLLTGWSTAATGWCNAVECSTESELPDCEITAEEDAALAHRETVHNAPKTCLLPPAPRRTRAPAPPREGAAGPSLAPLVPLRV